MFAPTTPVKSSAQLYPLAALAPLVSGAPWFLPLSALAIPAIALAHSKYVRKGSRSERPSRETATISTTRHKIRQSTLCKQRPHRSAPDHPPVTIPTPGHLQPRTGTLRLKPAATLKSPSAPLSPQLAAEVTTQLANTLAVENLISGNPWIALSSIQEIAPCALQGDALSYALNRLVEQRYLFPLQINGAHCFVFNESTLEAHAETMIQQLWKA